MKSARFWVVVLLMTGAALVLRARGNVDRVPPSAPLAELPQTIGGFTGRDLPIAPAVLDVLGKGSFLNRIYTPAQAGPPVTLFIAYFPTQRTGQAIHSPQNCLPGSGWTFISSGVTDLADPTGKRYQVGEYVISDGKSKQEVLYWYRSHGRSIANDYTAKLYTLADSIRLNRTDAALIRVVTPLASNANDAQHEAHLRAVAFAQQVVPLLPPYIPD
jgi:EpsI family protein